jgi:N-acetylglutamate synthase-like GNAT family acetyltransferase
MGEINHCYVSTEKEKLDVDLIHRYLSEEAYWSKGIPKDVVKESIRNSLNFGLYDKENQVGYARVISDFATIAYLGDVFILPEYRGKGLAKKLMKEVMHHPKLQGLRRWILLTGDAQGLYKQFGWTAIEKPEKWMEIADKNVYQTRL